MRIYFRGVGEASERINFWIEHPTCPRVGETVSFDGGDTDWLVKHVMHVLDHVLDHDYDVYVVVG